MELPATAYPVAWPNSGSLSYERELRHVKAEQGGFRAAKGTVGEQSL
jgi:hypothetical protein